MQKIAIKEVQKTNRTIRPKKPRFFCRGSFFAFLVLLSFFSMIKTAYPIAVPMRSSGTCAFGILLLIVLDYQMSICMARNSVGRPGLKTLPSRHAGTAERTHRFGSPGADYHIDFPPGNKYVTRFLCCSAKITEKEATNDRTEF